MVLAVASRLQPLSCLTVWDRATSMPSTVCRRLQFAGCQLKQDFYNRLFDHAIREGCVSQLSVPPSALGSQCSQNHPPSRLHAMSQTAGKATQHFQRQHSHYSQSKRVLSCTGAFATGSCAIPYTPCLVVVLLFSIAARISRRPERSVIEQKVKKYSSLDNCCGSTCCTFVLCRCHLEFART